MTPTAAKPVPVEHDLQVQAGTAYQLVVDSEIRTLIPPPRAEELAELERAIVAEGCRDAIVTCMLDGKVVVLDGHNRLEICQRRGVEFKTRALHLPNREQALLWIEENQLARRNLNDDQRAAIILSVVQRRSKLQVHVRAVKGGKAGGRHHLKPVSLPEASTDKLKRPRRDTRVEVARAHRASAWKLRQAAEVEKKKPELLVPIRAGDMTLREARAQIKSEEREEKVAAYAVKAEAAAPNGKYDVIVVDPPWRYDVRAADETHRGRCPYPTMTLDEIKAFRKVCKAAADDCVLWLWTTNAHMEAAYAVLRTWGFEPKTILTWVKNTFGMGNWLRCKTEHCIMAVHGKPVVDLKDQTTVLFADMREHSRKPDEFYAMVETLCPGSRAEFFARQPRPGWAQAGNELGAIS